MNEDWKEFARAVILGMTPEDYGKPLATLHRLAAHAEWLLAQPSPSEADGEWNAALEEAAIYLQEQDCAHKCGIGAEIADKIRSRKRSSDTEESK